MIQFCDTTLYHDNRVLGNQSGLQTIAGSQTAPSNEGENSTFHCREGDAGGPLIIDARVYILGDKYDILALKDVAARMYKDAVKDRWNSPTFATNAQLVYENTAIEEDKLRGIIVEVVRENLADLMIREDFLALLQRNAEMAKDILVAVGRGGSGSTTGGGSDDGAGKCIVCDGPTVPLKPLQELICASCRETGQYS
jgi:hypothetical protein